MTTSARREARRVLEIEAEAVRALAATKLPGECFKIRKLSFVNKRIIPEKKKEKRGKRKKKRNVKGKDEKRFYKFQQPKG